MSYVAALPYEEKIRKSSKKWYEMQKTHDSGSENTLLQNQFDNNLQEL